MKSPHEPVKKTSFFRKPIGGFLNFWNHAKIIRNTNCNKTSTNKKAKFITFATTT